MRGATLHCHTQPLVQPVPDIAVAEYQVTSIQRHHQPSMMSTKVQVPEYLDHPTVYQQSTATHATTDVRLQVGISMT